jgi:hypothetical protein
MTQASNVAAEKAVEQVKSEQSSLSFLAAFAVKHNNVKAVRKNIYAWDLNIEKARAKVIIRDGNKYPAEDGSVAIVLGFSKRTLRLDVIKSGATRVNAKKDQVEQFTAMLQAEVTSGTFDEQIVLAQKELKKADEERKVELASAGLEVTESTDVEAPAEVDLGAL